MRSNASICFSIPNCSYYVQKSKTSPPPDPDPPPTPSYDSAAARLVKRTYSKVRHSLRLVKKISDKTLYYSTQKAILLQVIENAFDLIFDISG